MSSTSQEGCNLHFNLRLIYRVSNDKQWQIAVIAVHSWNEASFCSDKDVRLMIVLLTTDAFMNIMYFGVFLRWFD